MVFTKLLLDDSIPGKRLLASYLLHSLRDIHSLTRAPSISKNFASRKFPFGVLAAQPEEVAADLVPKILAQKTTNGGICEFLTTDKILTKFFERFVLQKKRDYIDDDGNVIKFPGEQYDADGVRALY